MTSLSELAALVASFEWAKARRQARAHELLDDDDAPEDVKLAALLDLADHPIRVRLCRWLAPNALGVISGQVVVGTAMWEALRAALRASGTEHRVRSVADGTLLELRE